MRILMTTPFFSNLGGSELETIHTANAFAIIDEIKQIDLFVYGSFDMSFATNITIDSKVRFIKFPPFFRNKNICKIDKILKKIMGLESSLFENLYWRIKLLTEYSNIYIITKSSQIYFIPLIRLYFQKDKIAIKYTTIFYELMTGNKCRYLSRVRENLVTSNSQKNFFKEELGLMNTFTQEVIIYNEEYALSKIRKCYDRSLFDFGFLGRFSPEKQIEDAIVLIENLKTKGYCKTLLIRGNGELEYYNKIVRMIEEKGLANQITVEFQTVSYDEIFDFLDRINCFLITSIYEGGPNIGLEVMAYGLPILSYKVGAMPDRLREFPDFIVNNQDELFEKAVKVLNYSDFDFKKKCNDLKSKYCLYYSNKFKLAYIQRFLFD